MKQAQSTGNPALEAGGKQVRDDYLNLGFIPGGPAGLRQFSLTPTSLFQSDFSGAAKPFEFFPDLTIQNFQMIVVASASADGIQNWIQQVQPAMGQGQPLTAITSAAAEPLVAPYASGGDTAQLSAVVTGLSGAIEYDTASQRGGAAVQTTQRWASFGYGLYTIAGIISVGALLSSLVVLLRRRPVSKKAAARARPAPKAAPVVQPEPVAAEEPYYESAPSYTEVEPEREMQPVPVSKPRTKPSTTKQTKSSTTKKSSTSVKGKTTPTKGKAKPKPRPKAQEPELETMGPAKSGKPRMRKV